MIKVTSKIVDKIDLELLNKIKQVKKELINNPPVFIKEIYQLDKVLLEFSKLDNVKKNKDTLVILGVGGSDLGFRAIFNALTHSNFNELDNVSSSNVNSLSNDKNLTNFKKVYFAGDTTEPKYLNELLDVLDLSKTLFLVLSKSGNTIETLSSFLFFYTKVKKLNLNIKEHFVFITNEVEEKEINTNANSSNILRDISLKHNVITIDIPKELGGRFSVLSSVGLIPSLLLNLDVNSLIKGAIDLDNNLDEVTKYVSFIYSEYLKNKNINVLMPYSKYLTYFSKWYVQLISESLGKVDNNNVTQGITPISNLGPLDQHSQLQLYIDGIKNKVITFINVTNASNTLDIAIDNNDINELSFLSNKSFNSILNLEYRGTQTSMDNNEIPNITLEIVEVNAYYLGQLFYFFELVTLILGNLLEVNVFNQPGVEESKEYVRENLKSVA